MADLDMQTAQMLVDQLITVGHPMLAGARVATALDLVAWCKGGIYDGRPWTPAEQAAATVAII